MAEGPASTRLAPVNRLAIHDLGLGFTGTWFLLSPRRGSLFAITLLATVVVVDLVSSLKLVSTTSLTHLIASVLVFLRALVFPMSWLTTVVANPLRFLVVAGVAHGLNEVVEFGF